jgi:hypothetical protein
LSITTNKETKSGNPEGPVYPFSVDAWYLIPGGMVKAGKIAGSRIAMVIYRKRVYRIIVFAPIPLQQECDYGDNNKDYYEPFCDFHAETGYPFHAHDKKHQGKDQENYCKID